MCNSITASKNILLKISQNWRFPSIFLCKQLLNKLNKKRLFSRIGVEDETEALNHHESRSVSISFTHHHVCFRYKIHSSQYKIKALNCNKVINTNSVAEKKALIRSHTQFHQSHTAFAVYFVSSFVLFKLLRFLLIQLEIRRIASVHCFLWYCSCYLYAWVRLFILTSSSSFT